MQKSRVELAAKRHKEGYNCAQAVACTYSDLLGLSEEDAFRVAEGFGLGISGTFATCGCVSAMIILAGLKNSDGNLEKPASKLLTFELGQKMMKEFEDKNTSTVCKVLRGTDGVTDRVRSCRGCVIDCARIIEHDLFPEEFEEYDGEEY